MNHNLILIGSIFLISSFANCIEPYYKYEVQSICSEDIFRFKDFNGEEKEVNTIVRTPFNRMFYSTSIMISDYKPKRYLDEFDNEKNALEMDKLLSLYNKKILEIYSEEYLNNPIKFNHIEADLKIIKEYHSKMHHIIDNHLINSLTRLDLFGRTNRGIKFMKLLTYFSKNRFDAYEETLNQFSNQLKILTNDLALSKYKNMKFSLKGETNIEIFTNYEIISVNKFNLIESFGEKKGQINLDIILPFYNPKYKNETNVKDCVKLNALPKFYKKHLSN